MTVVERLEHEGFTHYTNDEPHEDYWILVRLGHGIDILVEKDDDGWRVCRSAIDEEDRGFWVDIASDLGEEACIAEIEGLL